MRTGIYARDMKNDMDQYVDNIVKMYHLASDDDQEIGRSWYQQASRFCETLAENYDRSLAAVAGIMSALSPSTSYEQNIIDTVNVIAENDHETVSTYGKQHAKALEIRDEGIDPALVMGQNKTAAFWLNIVNPTTSGRVTVDRHSARVAVDWTMNADEVYFYNNTTAKYSVLEHAYQLAAEHLDILPHVLQAITWTAYRRLFVGRKNGVVALAAKRASVATLAADLPF